MGALLVVMWFGLLVFWSVWVTDKVRRWQHKRTRQQCVDLVRGELRAVGTRDDVPPAVAAATQGALLRVIQRLNNDERRY